MSWQLKKAYFEKEIPIASSVRLVEISFDIAVSAIENARECCQKRDIVGRAKFVNKAYETLVELSGALDFEAGGELALNYERLYDYCRRRLTEAHAQQSDAMLAEVQSLLSELREAWHVVVSKQSSLCLTDEELEQQQTAAVEGESRFSYVG